MFKTFFLTGIFISLCFFYSSATVLVASVDPISKMIKLSWVKTDHRLRKFFVQKSTDKINWETIDEQSVTDFYNEQYFQTFDKNKEQKPVHYRLKQQSAFNAIFYSETATIDVASGNGNWSIYPIPATDLLTLQYNGEEKIKGVIAVFIENASGRTFNKMRCASLCKTIKVPVDNLGRGIYNIKVVILNQLVWSSRFIK